MALLKKPAQTRTKKQHMLVFLVTGHQTSICCVLVVVYAVFFQQGVYPYVTRPPRPIKVTIYARDVVIFSQSLFSFLGAQRILGYVRPRSIVAVHPSKNREKKDVFVGCIWRSLWIGTDFAQRCDVIALQMQRLNWDTATEFFSVPAPETSCPTRLPAPTHLILMISSSSTPPAW